MPDGDTTGGAYCPECFVYFPFCSYELFFRDVLLMDEKYQRTGSSDFDGVWSEAEEEEGAAMAKNVRKYAAEENKVLPASRYAIGSVGGTWLHLAS